MTSLCRLFGHRWVAGATCSVCSRCGVNTFGGWPPMPRPLPNPPEPPKLSMPNEKIPPVPERCLNCRWFDVDAEDRDDDFRWAPCRRHAPVDVVEGPTSSSRWPMVHGYDWCGDFARVSAAAPAVEQSA